MENNIQEFFQTIDTSNFIENNDDYEELLGLLEEADLNNVSLDFFDLGILKKMTQTHHFQQINAILNKLDEIMDTTSLRIAHEKYCDKLIADIENNDIDLTQLTSNSEQSKNSFDAVFLKDTKKYFLISVLLSRYFQTSPNNALIDLNTLCDYILDDERLRRYAFKNIDIYEKIVHFNNYSTSELIDLYHSLKDKNIMEDFYDDWHLAIKEFVEELNEKIVDKDHMPPKDDDLSRQYGIDIYRIAEDYEHFILVHNTGINIYLKEKIREIFDRQKHFLRTCFSIQNQNHVIYFLDYQINSLILVFGGIDPYHLTNIYPTDAFSSTISDNKTYHLKKIFPLRRLMQLTGTYDYNELTYYPYIEKYNDIETIQEHLIPLAILCDDEIKERHIEIAKEMNIPIIIREKSKILRKTTKIKPYYKDKLSYD